jgi:hypothetical protein
MFGRIAVISSLSATPGDSQHQRSQCITHQRGGAEDRQCDPQAVACLIAKGRAFHDLAIAAPSARRRGTLLAPGVASNVRRRELTVELAHSDALKRCECFRILGQLIVATCDLEHSVAKHRIAESAGERATPLCAIKEQFDVRKEKNRSCHGRPLYGPLREQFRTPDKFEQHQMTGQGACDESFVFCG